MRKPRKIKPDDEDHRAVGPAKGKGEAAKRYRLAQARKLIRSLAEPEAPSRQKLPPHVTPVDIKIVRKPGAR